MEKLPPDLEAFQRDLYADKLLALYEGLPPKQKEQMEKLLDKPESKRTIQEWLKLLEIIRDNLPSDDEESRHLREMCSDLSRRFHDLQIKEKLQKFRNFIWEYSDPNKKNNGPRGW